MINNYKDKYLELTGKEATLAQADPVRLMLYSCAVAIYQGYQYEDQAGKMGLLKYSKGEFLDNLAAWKGVKRNPPQKAVTTLKFTLATTLKSAVIIPKGTKVKADSLYFSTTEHIEIPAGEIQIEVPALCMTDGTIGNGFLPGEIKTLVEPLGYNLSVTNITISSGGADEENDEKLAERIYLAPSRYSTAGPESAYRYWVKSFNQSIQDCHITSENPGEVDIYILLKNGKIPNEDYLQQLKQYLEKEDKKPLTDYVVVKPPEIIEYNIDIIYYIDSAQYNMADTIKKEVEQACNNFVQWQQEAIGRDINPSRLTYLVVQAGAKWLDIREPVFTPIQSGKIAVAKSINITYGGLQDA